MGTFPFIQVLIVLSLGYLNISNEKAFHYVFFTSQNKPASDPVVLWLNGGPGCSSLIGMVTQNGPFIFQENSTSYAINEFAWNKNANLLYIESPGSVGFSVGPIPSSDNSVKADNLNAVLAFLLKFPSLRRNEFYLSGQSYAGIYVPYLALAIHEYNKNAKAGTQINLKGFLIGNACTDPKECYDAGDGFSVFVYQFLYNHMFYNDDEYNRFTRACAQGYLTDKCVAVRQALDAKLDSTHTQLENVYSKCYNQPSSKSKKLSQSGNFRPLTGGLDCSDTIGARTFWNNPEIRKYFHVQGVNSNYVWDFCQDSVGEQYTKNANASYWIYPILMNAGYRIWVYSGDVDANVPITGTLTWINKLRLENSIPIQEAWRSWASVGRRDGEDQVGGFIWKLQNLTFVSIRDAGHMVPHDQPQSAYSVLTAFLGNKDLPRL